MVSYVHVIVYSSDSSYDAGSGAMDATPWRPSPTAPADGRCPVIGVILKRTGRSPTRWLPR